MKVSENSLRDLHSLHKRISSLREKIEHGPRQIKARRLFVADKAEAFEKARVEHKSLKVQGNQKEVQSKSLENRIQDLQIKINSAKSNKEYALLVQERDADKTSQSLLEDEILEILFRQDEQEKQIKIAEQELERHNAELAELMETVEGRSEQLVSSLAECEERLQTAESSLPSDMQDIYRRVIKTRGQDALSSVTGQTCRGCYTSITPQMHNELLQNTMVLCKSCGRILYMDQDGVRDALHS